MSEKRAYPVSDFPGGFVVEADENRAVIIVLESPIIQKVAVPDLIRALFGTLPKEEQDKAIYDLYNGFGLDQ